jgi:hypothetical protein
LGEFFLKKYFLLFLLKPCFKKPIISISAL